MRRTSELLSAQAGPTNVLQGGPAHSIYLARRRLGSEANALRSEQRDIAAAAAARRAARDAYRLSLERTADFRRMCSGKGGPARAARARARRCCL